MVELDQTSKAIAALRSHEELGFGFHTSNQVVVGGRGPRVGEMPFDPSVHQLRDINQLSPVAELTGWPRVSLRLQSRPLNANVIIHDDSANDPNRPEWLDVMPTYKSLIARGLYEAIDRAKHVGDSVNVFLVGNPQHPERYGDKVTYVENSENPMSAAEKISSLCEPGILNFLLSDFIDLPLTELGDSPTTKRIFRRTVALKTNHPFELEVPPDVGVIPLGGKDEIDTSSHTKHGRAKFQGFNEGLGKQHVETLAALGRAGIVLAATVAFDGGQELTDKSIIRMPADGPMAILDKPLAKAAEKARRQ